MNKGDNKDLLFSLLYLLSKKLLELYRIHKLNASLFIRNYATPILSNNYNMIGSSHLLIISRRSAVGSRQSAVSGRRLAVSARDPMINDRQSHDQRSHCGSASVRRKIRLYYEKGDIYLSR